MERATKQAAEMILTKSQEVCPVYRGPHTRSSPDPGLLQRSGTVSWDPSRFVAIISYNTPYAVYQHELITQNRIQGKDKYLETPFNENGEAAVKYVAHALKGLMD